MANEIGRNLSDIDNTIKSLNSSLKDAKTEAKDLDSAMKLNPASVEAVSNKYANLSKQLQLTQQKAEALRQKQQALTEAFQNGSISEQSYNTKLASVQKQLQACTTQETQLTNALKNQQSAMDTARLTSYGNSLDKLAKKTKTLSTLTTALVAAMGALVASAVSTGDELYDTAKKYDTSVETLQVWSNRLTQAASDSDAYVEALSSIGTVQAAILKNGGERYASYLEELGITTEELADVSKADAFDMIFAALQNMTDETEMATIAQGLFGDSGLDIATIAELTNDEIENLDATLDESTMITTDQAAAADELNNKIEEMKLKFEEVGAELLESLEPVLEDLCDLLEDTVIPVIEKLSDWFGSLNEGQQEAVLIILMLIIILPKLCSGIGSLVTKMGTMSTATSVQAAATGTLSAASTPLIPIFLAIAIAMMIVITIMSLFSSKAAEAADSATALADSLSGLSDAQAALEEEAEATAESYSETSSTSEVKMDIDINATGDGDTNQAAADTVADAVSANIIDYVNEQFGVIVK